MGAWCQLCPDRNPAFLIHIVTFSNYRISHKLSRSGWRQKQCCKFSIVLLALWRLGNEYPSWCEPALGMSEHAKVPKSFKAGQCLKATDNVERKHGNSLPKLAACCLICHKDVMQNCCDWGGMASGDVWRTCSRMPHHKTMIMWL